MRTLSCSQFRIFPQIEVLAQGFLTSESVLLTSEDKDHGDGQKCNAGHICPRWPLHSPVTCDITFPLVVIPALLAERYMYTCMNPQLSQCPSQ